MVPIPDRKAETVARAMVDHWVALFGPPRIIISDRGAEIVGKVMAEVCEIFGIKQQTTTAHHPQVGWIGREVSSDGTGDVVKDVERKELG